MLGLSVVNGYDPILGIAFETHLNNVDLPALGNPT